MTNRYMIFPVLISILITTIITSCINEDDSECVQYAVTAHAVDKAGNNISGSAVNGKEALLFINNRFDHTVAPENDGRYLISFDGGSKASLVIFGNVSNDSLSMKAPVAGDSIENLSVQVNSATRQTEGGSAYLPDYLFYGRFDYAPVNKENELAVSLPLYNKRARLRVVLKNLQDRFGSGNYTVKVEGFRNGMTFSGEVTGDSVSYEPGGAFNSDGSYVTEAVNVLPSKKGEYVTLSVYKDGVLLLSTSTDENGKRVTLAAGDDDCMIINVSAIKYFIVVMPWNDSDQGTVFY